MKSIKQACASPRLNYLPRKAAAQRVLRALLRSFITLSLSISTPLATASPAAWGQAPQDQAQRLLDEQRRQLREQTVRRPPPGITAPTPGASSEEQELAELAQEAAAISESETSFPITEIRLSGDDHLLSDTEQQALIAPFIGLRLGPRRIDLLLRRITAAYLARGYVSTRAYLAPQNLTSGLLHVTVIPGRIDRIVVDGRTPAATQEPVLPLHQGETLKMADVEQSIDQINRLRSRRAEASIQPGQSPGGSDVVINTHPEKPWRLSAGTDNYGLTATGVQRQRISVEIDNLLGLWDSWAATRVESANALSELVSVTLPAGYGTFSYTYARARCSITLPAPYDLISRCESVSHNYGWNQVVARNQSSRQALDLGLALRDSRRHLNDFALMPQQQSVIRLAASHLWRGQRAAFDGELAYSKGIKSFGGDGDYPELPASAPHNEFEKWDASLLYALNITPDLAWRSEARGQGTDTGLPAADQLYLGGIGSIRGFREGIIAGDRGVIARNELQWNTALPRALMRDGWRLAPYVFLDAGRVRLLADGEDQRLVSLGGGLRAGWHDITAEFTWGRPQTAPAGIPRHDYINLSFTLQY
jgi:hemolysin activation/secretion protein